MKVLALFLSLVASPLSAQSVSYSVGLQDLGKLAPEATHHARVGALGRDVFFQAAIEWKHVQVFGRFMPSYLQVWPCRQVPCETISRWSSRPDTAGHAEPLLFSVVGIGARRVLGPLALAGGASLNVISAARHEFWGATPMGTIGGWLSARIGTKAVGFEVGLNAIPPQPARFVTISEWTGSKQNGKPARESEGTILGIHAGVSISAH